MPRSHAHNPAPSVSAVMEHSSTAEGRYCDGRSPAAGDRRGAFEFSTVGDLDTHPTNTARSGLVAGAGFQCAPGSVGAATNGGARVVSSHPPHRAGLITLRGVLRACRASRHGDPAAPDLERRGLTARRAAALHTAATPRRTTDGLDGCRVERGTAAPALMFAACLAAAVLIHLVAWLGVAWLLYAAAVVVVGGLCGLMGFAWLVGWAAASIGGREDQDGIYLD